MAMNGTTEAFVLAKGNQQTLQKVRKLMVANSLLYIATGYMLSTSYVFGDIRGVIIANCVNMAVRASSSVYLAAE